MDYIVVIDDIFIGYVVILGLWRMLKRQQKLRQLVSRVKCYFNRLNFKSVVICNEHFSTHIQPDHKSELLLLVEWF